MTRDTARIQTYRDSNDDGTYATLWALAPFPRLPEDAPPELKKLTIEINDPRRVYAIHRATRRHHFQLLLDRFIHQIRYGCTYKACNVTTCFSCRKRLANGAPVRRYNSTSSRTLALHMISLDNPEQGLCPHPPAKIINETNKHLKPKKPQILDDALPLIYDDFKKKTSSKKDFQAPGNPDTPRRNLSSENGLKDNIIPEISVLEGPTAIDHRSFIQNIYETVSFKMIEWLTPSKLQGLVEIQAGNKPNKVCNLTSGNESDCRSVGSTEVESLTPPTHDHKNEDSNDIKSLSITGKFKESRPRNESDPILPQIMQPTQTSPYLLKRRNSADSLGLKGALKQALKDDSKFSKITSPRQRSSEFLNRKSFKPALLKSPKLRSREQECSLENIPSSTLILDHVATEKPKLNFKFNSTDDIHLGTSQDSSISEESIGLSTAKVELLPQSLSSLTIETIELLCNILQTDGNCEKHSLYPQTVSEALMRQRNLPHPPSALKRNKLFQNPLFYPNPGKHKWKAFIEQSFFDVLGNAQSLLQTFSNENKVLFDSQTIWYLMLRMTRVAPNLVFESLWHVAETLFSPPQKLKMACDWAKDSSVQKPLLKPAVSNYDAAQIVNICLHALVAAAPLIDDPRQMINVSRIRSCGLTKSSRETSQEVLSYCLQYEDAFTNELAVRLARRVFAAIPTRRIFSESLELQGIHRERQESDILDIILNTFEFLNPDTPPMLKFTDDERSLHEKRLPSVILDWARTVMLQEWRGSAEVPSDGPFGGALATIDAIYKNRKSLLLGDIHFRTDYFAERLDPFEMPVEWISFNANKKTVHLLNYPYLFNPANLITYFRAINYSKMSLAFETAKAELIRMNYAMHENTLMTNNLTRDKLQERLRTATTKFMVLEVRRTHVLLDTFNSIWRREERELMRPLKLRLGEEGGEEGSDSGGVQQEFLRLAIAEALDPDYGAFTTDTQTRMTWFQPGSPEPLWKYELIGMIISLAVYNGLTLPVTFPKALYRKLLCEEVTELHHIADGWPDLTRGLTSLLEWDENDGSIEDVFARTYEFSVEQFGVPVSCVMKEMDSSTPSWPQFPFLSDSASPNSTEAPFVTSKNRNNYVSSYIRYLTDVSVRPQFEAFKTGFFTCISRHSVSLFNAPTLQSLIEGIQEIDVRELSSFTRYIGWDGDSNHHTIKDFWSVVMNYDLRMKRKLLEFVTASDRVPVGGMRGLQFTIQRNGIGDRLLPTSYTCYGILLLPEYSVREILEQRLAMALANSQGFGFA
ncbi:Bgt-4252 [Blumeria graminis f. sp. tritici]|uniref:HECT-type E3 ubiquitin transferase n=2 Tax=Blumeria graminis f. sp. tritici TaxID=62690 RepID=A0A381L974_BLUGR|nr:hypothetical protein BGT96224_4252 [Blumeria graminis f. sp. tritici 96224]VDB87788.1 Bgt-4252 [Blumeria graminis f. sp. tritici]